MISEILWSPRYSPLPLGFKYRCPCSHNFHPLSYCHQIGWFFGDSPSGLWTPLFWEICTSTDAHVRIISIHFLLCEQLTWLVIDHIKHLVVPWHEESHIGMFVKQTEFNCDCQIFVGRLENPNDVLRMYYRQFLKTEFNYNWTIGKSKRCFENVLSAMSVPGCCFTRGKSGTIPIHICHPRSRQTHSLNMIFLLIGIFGVFIIGTGEPHAPFLKGLCQFLFRVCPDFFGVQKHHEIIKIFPPQLCILWYITFLDIYKENLWRKLHTLELDYYQHWYYPGAFTVLGKYRQRR